MMSYSLDGMKHPDSYLNSTWKKKVGSDRKQASAKQEDLTRRAERFESELKRVTGELQTSQATLHEVTAREKAARQHVAGQKEHIAELMDSEGQMRDSLESLFGDMVALDPTSGDYSLIGTVSGVVDNCQGQHA